MFFFAKPQFFQQRAFSSCQLKPVLPEQLKSERASNFDISGTSIVSNEILAFCRRKEKVMKLNNFYQDHFFDGQRKKSEKYVQYILKFDFVQNNDVVLKEKPSQSCLSSSCVISGPSSPQWPCRPDLKGPTYCELLHQPSISSSSSSSSSLWCQLFIFIVQMSKYQMNTNCKCPRSLISRRQLSVFNEPPKIPKSDKTTSKYSVS